MWVKWGLKIGSKMSILGKDANGLTYIVSLYSIELTVKLSVLNA